MERRRALGPVQEERLLAVLDGFWIALCEDAGRAGVAGFAGREVSGD